LSRNRPAEGAAPADPPVTPQDPPPAAEAAAPTEEPTSDDESDLPPAVEGQVEVEPDVTAQELGANTDPEPAPEPQPPPAIPLAARVSRERIEFLGTLAVNRYGLYRFPGLGFATEQRGPFYPEAFVDGAVADGFAYFEPTGGSHGSVKITEAGRAAYRALRQTEALPQAV